MKTALKKGSITKKRSKYSLHEKHSNANSDVNVGGNRNAEGSEGNNAGSKKAEVTGTTGVKPASMARRREAYRKLIEAKKASRLGGYKTVTKQLRIWQVVVGLETDNQGNAPEKCREKLNEVVPIIEYVENVDEEGSFRSDESEGARSDDDDYAFDSINNKYGYRDVATNEDKEE